MKKGIITLAMAMMGMVCFAQEDTTRTNKPDTIKIGNMIIIKKAGNSEGRTITMKRRDSEKPANISTSWWIFDIGFANWNDETDYAAATTGQYIINRPGSPALGESDFSLRTGKSSNVNLWIFMQRMNLIKHHVNLKYGLGLEMNNYRFKSPVSFKEAGENPYMRSRSIGHAFAFRDSVVFSKNKLAADYVTVPFMINFTSNPNSSSRGISISAGVSAGYLYSIRNKQVSGERGKRKNKGDYDLEKWKLSYIAELGIGPARLYGSYSPRSIFEKGFKLMPYAVGVRFSNW
jgi:hypothetical protein